MEYNTPSTSGMIIPMPTVTLVRYQPPPKSVPSIIRIITRIRNGVNGGVCVFCGHRQFAG